MKTREKALEALRERSLVTKAEFARAGRTTPKTVDEAIRRGQLEVVPFGRRQMIKSKSALRLLGEA